MSLRRPFGGGGSMIRGFGRVVSARTGVPGGSSSGIQDPVAPNGAGNTNPTTRPTSPIGGQRVNRQLSLSAYSSPVSPRSSSGCGASSPLQGLFDEGDWVFADGVWEESQMRKDLYFDDFVLGSIPSPEEVHGAVSAVQQVFDSAAFSHLIKDRYGAYVDKEVTDVSNGSGSLLGVSSGGADDDWIEPDLHLCNNDSTRALQPIGTDKVLDAFHLLQTDPSVQVLLPSFKFSSSYSSLEGLNEYQWYYMEFGASSLSRSQRMVISLSSDKTVWDAVLNNEVVKELRNSCSSGYISNLLSFKVFACYYPGYEFEFWWLAGEVTSLSDESSCEESNDANEVKEAVAVIKWIFGNTVLRIMEVVDMMTRLVSDLFDDSGIDQEASAKGGRADRNPFEEKLRTSFLLTVVVLLVVAVARARRA